ncbi:MULTISPECIES: hypothetical protein [Leptospira]|uniref:hypothetical protein n=1 Tax=Leptospira TaxID=171 RepID=UPI0003463A88|nr:MULTISPECIES: hypothetical protein [Leptospira]MCL8267988.1 hypothetical protein [Leptospira weilii]MDL5246973.1 hypothetical protein [Leptospira weilii]
MSLLHTNNRMRRDVVIFVCILYASVESPLRVVLSYELAVNGLYVLVNLFYFGDR